ncbi:MAG: phosphate transport system permease protein, partial [Yoonia sp.]
MTAVKRKSLLEIDARTKQRNAQERRFRAYGFSAIAVAVVALVILLTS